jgi:hypothetical protein
MTPVLELNPVSTSQERKPVFKPVSDAIQILPESDLPGFSVLLHIDKYIPD